MSKIRNTGITDGAFGTLATLPHQPKRLLVYGHVHICLPFQEAKTKCWLLDDLWPDCVALIIHY